MKHVFLVQDVSTSMFLAFDAPGNWVEEISEADRFDSQSSAEHIVSNLIQENQVLQIQCVQVYDHYKIR